MNGEKFETYQAGGAFHSGANFRSPLVDTKRQVRECLAFFRIPNHLKTFGVLLCRGWTLWFVTEIRGAVPECHFSLRYPFQTGRNSLTLCLTEGCWLTGLFAKDAVSNCTELARAFAQSSRAFWFEC